MKRFWDKTQRADSGCILWTASKDSWGYGLFRFDGAMKGAHRVAWMLHHGNIPDGMQIDHRCHQPGCVNVEHMRLVTPKQNCENMKGSYRNNRSGALGVSKNSRGKYVVRVTHDRQYHYGGTFTDFEVAKKAATDLRNSLFTHNDSDRVAK